MAHIIEDNVGESSTTTGAGDLTLAGALTAHKTFSSVMTSPSDTCEYVVFAVDGSGVATGEWEQGLGTYSAANTLTRTTVRKSSNSDSAVSFSAGTKHVVLTNSAAEIKKRLAQGRHTIPIMAGAMTPRTTNGCAALADSESTTNKVMTSTLDFDDTTQEHAQFAVPMPKSWDEGTVTATFTWTTAATTGNCIWGIQAVALADDDAADTAFGTAQEVTDGASAAGGDILISAETSPLTVAGSPSDEEFVVFQIYRKAADGSDTLTGDAKLLAVRLYVTIDAEDDT